ncbi:MAG: A24 family peptidase [Lachnospiraceae bacterium]|nr:A24 family peptidase [Lachnospiraceae bacterium]
MDNKITVLLIFSMIAAIMDIISLRVSNYLIIAGMITGLSISVYRDGAKGALSSLIGALIPFLLLFVFFIFRYFGAGDIKLFSMIGTFLGPQGVMLVLIYAVLTGGIMGAVKYILTYKEKGLRKIPFAIPAFIGVALLAGGMM